MMNVKRVVIVFLTAVAAMSVSASDVVKRWGDGALEWTDFAGAAEGKPVMSAFKGRLEFDHGAISPAGGPTVIAVMDKAESYAEPAGRIPRMLRYHRLQFDMLEIVCRRLQAELDGGISGSEADARLAYYQRLYDEQMADLARATVNGSNELRMRDYENAARAALAGHSVASVSDRHSGDFFVGWFAGTGALIPTGEIADLLDYAWVFNAGFYGGYRRWVLKADISYGQPSLKDVFADPLNRPWGEGHRYMATNPNARQLSGTVSVGFRVVDTKRFSIAPHIGGGWTNYSWNFGDFEFLQEEDEWVMASPMRKETFGNFNVMCEIDFDWRFHATAIDGKGLFGNGRRQYVSSLRLTPYLMRQAYSSLSPERKGFQIGIHLTYSGFMTGF